MNQGGGAAISGTRLENRSRQKGDLDGEEHPEKDSGQRPGPPPYAQQDESHENRGQNHVAYHC